MLGISWVNPQSGKEEKRSLRADPKEVYVTNQINQNLEFSNVAPGDHVDIYTVLDSKGNEMVTDIWDYDKLEKD